MTAESVQENSLFPVKVTSSYIYFHMLAEFLYTVCAYPFFKFLSYCCANLIRYPLRQHLSSDTFLGRNVWVHCQMQ